jgi:predicted nucleic acid-binding protein
VDAGLDADATGARSHGVPLPRSAGRAPGSTGPGICDLEIGYAARNANEWDLLLGALDAFAAVQTSAAHDARALQVQRLLAAPSQRGRKLSDLLVAAAAEALDLTVLHYDTEFELISAVTGQAHEWVVPAGTVD